VAQQLVAMKPWISKLALGASMMLQDNQNLGMRTSLESSEVAATVMHLMPQNSWTYGSL
jgi:hypothetical protein